MTLINKIGLPVMIIGTPAALPLLQGAFRQARRTSGIGSAVWEPMPEGGDWEGFIRRMWAFQWTRAESPLTDEIVAVLRDESQGIVDVVIKLYMLAQLRAIQLGELGGREEVIDAGLIRHVAKTELTLIAPMIDALRRGDPAPVWQCHGPAVCFHSDATPSDDVVQQNVEPSASQADQMNGEVLVLAGKCAGDLELRPGEPFEGFGIQVRHEIQRRFPRLGA